MNGGWGVMQNCEGSLKLRRPVHQPIAERPDRMEEACGVYAVLAEGQPVANLTYFGLYSLQHRGQESAGIAVFNQGKVRLHKDMGLVSQVFDQDVLARMPGNLAIGHNRYSTTGSSKVCNAQPVVLMTRLGAFALAHNGNLVNASDLRRAVDNGQVEVRSHRRHQPRTAFRALPSDWRAGPPALPAAHRREGSSPRPRPVAESSGVPSAGGDWSHHGRRPGPD